MKLNKATANFFFDKRMQKSDGRFPLKLAIYYKKERKRYNINIDLTEEEWKKIYAPRLKDDSLKEKKLLANAILSKANTVLEKLSTFSFKQFEIDFFGEKKVENDLSLEYWVKEYMLILENDGRVGTRISYQTTLNSILKFSPNIKVHEITSDFLGRYEKYLLKQGKSPSTVGIYFRQLRAIMNRVINKGIIPRDQYPFHGYEIPSARNIKKALNDKQLEMLLTYKPKTTRHQKYLDFWIFSYLCNGMNFSDILHLKRENVSGSFLFYIRQKTKRTKKKDLRPIKVALTGRAIEIIERWKNTDQQNPFLFPVLDLSQSPKTIKYRTQGFIKKVNEAMEEIRTELKIPIKVRTYEARHSFGSRLMRIGASTQFIKESFGHSSVTVTENYLGDFEDSVKTEYSELLTRFS